MQSVKSSIHLEEKLQKWFGFSVFRSVQKQVLESLFLGESCLSLMPTGTGKSLCYQFFAKKFQEEAAGKPSTLVIVVSPLIALMQDQVQKALDLGLKAADLHSNLSFDERQSRMQKIKQGEYSLIFCTPERFSKSEFRECLSGRQIGLFAIDEAHCISLWGHDFRPDYAKLGEVRKFLGSPTVLALTATATPQVQQDIVKSLSLPEEKIEIFSGGIERSNLQLSVHDLYGTEEKLERLLELLQKKDAVSEGSVIVYATLIDTVYKISKFLSSKGIQHLMYHGDLKPHQRKKNLQDFMADEKSLMVATPAFGLGIDKPNIRQIFHFEIPGSLEDYYQQIGRAGRDGLISNADFLFDEEDLHIQMEFIRWSFPEESYIETIYKLISASPDRFRQEGFDFLREQISFKNKKDFRVESAVNILERWGCLQKSDDFSTWTVVQAPTKEMFQMEKSDLQMKAQNVKLLELLRYAKNEEDCRLVLIYKYFGHEGKPCGQCDHCRS